MVAIRVDLAKKERIKTMKYLVNAKGEITQLHNEVYVVKADSEEEAQEIATNRFREEYNSINETVQIRAFGSRKRNALLAVLFMSIAVIISFCKFGKDFGILGLTLYTKEIYLQGGGIMAIILGIVVYSVFIIRLKGIEELTQSFTDVALCVLSILLFASLFNLALDGEAVLGLNSSTMYLLLILGAFFSTVKEKLAAVICIFIVMLASLGNIIGYSDAMGIWGIVYIMCAFLGFLFHFSIEPQVLASLPQMGKMLKKHGNNFKSDVVEAGKELNKIKNSAKKDSIK